MPMVLLKVKEHFDIAGSWRAHLESLGYEFPEEEWVTYDPSSTGILRIGRQ